MIQQTPHADLFKQQLRDSLQRETLNSRALKIAKHASVYTCGDQGEMVYFIESGQIKLLMLSSEGKECLLAIHAAGDIFGELCLAGSGARLETATAMKTDAVKANSLFSVLRAFGPRFAVRRFRTIPGDARGRPTAGHCQLGNSG